MVSPLISRHFIGCVHIFPLFFASSRKKTLPLRPENNLVMSKKEVKQDLSQQLKREHCFWSFNEDSIQDIPDDVLIEKALVYLDLQDIDKLFTIYSFRKIKRVWLDALVPQQDYYHSLNRFLAWWYFGIKKPDSYLKAMNTRHLNKWLQ